MDLKLKLSCPCAEYNMQLQNTVSLHHKAFSSSAVSVSHMVLTFARQDVRKVGVAACFLHRVATHHTASCLQDKQPVKFTLPGQRRRRKWQWSQWWCPQSGEMICFLYHVLTIITSCLTSRSWHVSANIRGALWRERGSIIWESGIKPRNVFFMLVMCVFPSWGATGGASTAPQLQTIKTKTVMWIKQTRNPRCWLSPPQPHSDRALKGALWTPTGTSSAFMLQMALQEDSQELQPVGKQASPCSQPLSLTSVFFSAFQMTCKHFNTLLYLQSKERSRQLCPRRGVDLRLFRSYWLVKMLIQGLEDFTSCASPHVWQQKQCAASFSKCACVFFFSVEVSIEPRVCRNAAAYQPWWWAAEIEMQNTQASAAGSHISIPNHPGKQAHPPDRQCSSPHMEAVNLYWSHSHMAGSIFPLPDFMFLPILKHTKPFQGLVFMCRGSARNVFHKQPGPFQSESITQEHMLVESVWIL